jgi:diacylglycerol kinase family enzyme
VQENLYLIVTNPFYHARKRQLINWLLHELAVRKLNYLFYETHADLSKNQHYFSEQLPRCCKVVVLGGDGTLHLAVNAMAGSDVSLALLPCGTGNDFARGLGWSLAEALLVNALL